ncbi:fibronectin type III domain-containing protein [Pedobacter terrae]|uniref:fibronectin type III domain-containing protein n=1 Tax=Pedobacter terrae TaxID=405671 RepID=UPI002FF97954
MKKNINLLVGSVLLLLTGCSEFIEPSIENREIAILAPANKLETNSYQQTFWWDPMADALFYRLQIVEPKFDSVSKMVLDTLIKTEKFVYTMDPGKYEWRVRGENGSSASSYSTRSLEIFPSSLKEQSVQLTVPSSGLYFSKPDVRYEWLKLFGAKVYRLQVDNNNFLDENNMTLNITTDNLGFLQTLSKEGTYQFRVRAENSAENSKWSNVRSFTYDATGPERVLLSTPL